ncbi:GNAT family N-acetyltransferase [Agaribacter marinus]|uniref:N-acetyltransferase n=1 Tax=Agaribacter marinus TaxID=1431249 RepID=A0AA37T5L3_9ALTE|nr:GNAT family N-acetyltransferase [Agaribacter marinus]GLR71965.1 N-acetyltransferase [Agaribacter marinus]
MKIEKISWQDALPIRHQVLWPNKAIDFCHVNGDEEAIHYGAYLKGLLVCVASIYIVDDEARLRKFATLPEHQGKGIGSKLILQVISDLKHHKIERFWCDARTTATSFYEKFGLTIDGEAFFKSGTAYYKMSVSLKHNKL